MQGLLGVEGFAGRRALQHVGVQRTCRSRSSRRLATIMAGGAAGGMGSAAGGSGKEVCAGQHVHFVHLGLLGVQPIA